MAIALLSSWLGRRLAAAAAWDHSYTAGRIGIQSGFFFLGGQAGPPAGRRGGMGYWLR